MMSTTVGSIGSIIGLPNSVMSAPAKKVWPWQMITTAFTASSPSASAIAATSPSRTAWPRAFTGGLFEVTIRTSPWRLVVIGLILVSVASEGRASIFLAVMGVRGGKAAVYDQRMAVHIGALVRGEEQSGLGDLGRLAAALQWVEVADQLFLPGRARHIVDRLRHAGLDQARADRIDADIGAGKLGRRHLDQADHPGLAGRISGPARACAN